ncbi:30S ribosomal protein S5 [Candidatus Babeliales bacterium]|nr:30S ribosomal protein S5 [Candidatus Babeliales bacterium]
MPEKRKKSTAPNAESKRGGKPRDTNEFSETVLNVRRVSKVVKGGRRLSFSALVVVGDQKGRVGVATGKGREVASAISKAVRAARKSMFAVPLYGATLPFTVEAKFGACHVLLRSASKGTGVIAGGAVRAVMEALGVHDVLGKSIGSSNSNGVAKATIVALQKLRSATHIAKLRGLNLNEMVGMAGGKNVQA